MKKKKSTPGCLLLRYPYFKTSLFLLLSKHLSPKKYRRARQIKINFRKFISLVYILLYLEDNSHFFFLPPTFLLCHFSTHFLEEMPQSGELCAAVMDEVWRWAVCVQRERLTALHRVLETSWDPRKRRAGNPWARPVSRVVSRVTLTPAWEEASLTSLSTGPRGGKKRGLRKSLHDV